jgi:hypothetical protein
MTNFKDIYTEFVALLDECEQIDSTPVYLGLLEVMKQDIEQRQKTCVEAYMRPDLQIKSQNEP